MLRIHSFFVKSPSKFFWIVCLMFFCFHSLSFAQENKGKNKKKNEVEPSIKYEEFFKGGAHLHTNGWGLNFMYGQNNTRKKSFILTADFVLALKHPKETKVVNPVYEQGNPYIYGKKNSLMAFRPGLGQQYRIADKEESFGVRVDLNYTVGPSLGILKPVYLEIVRNPQDGEPYRNTERYRPDVHVNQGNIYGGAPFHRGIGEISVEPGISAKSSLSFSWGDNATNYKSLETGVSVDAYLREMPIFAFIDNKQIFVNLYLSFSFGRHW